MTRELSALHHAVTVVNGVVLFVDVLVLKIHLQCVFLFISVLFVCFGQRVFYIFVAKVVLSCIFCIDLIFCTFLFCKKLHFSFDELLYAMKVNL